MEIPWWKKPWREVRRKFKTLKIKEYEINNGEEQEHLEQLGSDHKGRTYYYYKDKVLGEGGYGKVLKGFAIKGTKRRPVAIKIGYLSDVTKFFKDAKLGDIPKEVFILKNLPKHRAAIRFLHYQKLSPTTYAIITERPERSKDLGGLQGVKFFPFSEKQAQKIIWDLSSLLKKMKDMNLVHGDIKPNNIVYDLEKNVVKLIDFGLACYFEDGKSFDKFYGTQSYTPPEFLATGSYDPNKQTVWSLGIVAYYLVTGCRPYVNAEQAVRQPYGQPTHLKNLSAVYGIILFKLGSTNIVSKMLKTMLSAVA